MILNYCLSSALVLAMAQISWARANKLTTATSLRNTRVPRVTSWKPKLANMSSSLGSSHPPSGLHADPVHITKKLVLHKKSLVTGEKIVQTHPTAINNCRGPFFSSFGNWISDIRIALVVVTISSSPPSTLLRIRVGWATTRATSSNGNKLSNSSSINSRNECFTIVICGNWTSPHCANPSINKFRNVDGWRSMCDPK